MGRLLALFDSTLQFSSLAQRDIQLTMSQQHLLLVIERTSSMLSIVASSFVLLSFVLFNRLRRRPFNRLLFLATWGNLFANVATFIGNDGINAGTKSAVCKAQGMLIQWFMPADSLWTFCMAVNIFLTFNTSKVHLNISKLEKWYFSICYGIPAVPALTYLLLDVTRGTDYYGNAILWCWISEGHDVLRIATFYAPVWVVIAVTMSLYAITGWAIYKGQARNTTMENALNDMGSNCSTACDTGRVRSSIDDNLVKVHKCTEIQQTSELIANESEPNISPKSTAPSGEEPQSEGIGNEIDENIKSSSAISSRVATTVISLSAADMDSESPPLTPRHIPIVVPAFGNGMIKPLSIPLEHVPPHSRTPHPPGLLPSSFSITSSTRGRREQTSSRSHTTTYARVAFALYIIMLIVWVPSTVNRVYQLVTSNSGSSNTNVPLNIAAACVLPLQGLFNAVIYIFVGRKDIVWGIRSIWNRLLGEIMDSRLSRCVNECHGNPHGRMSETLKENEEVEEIVQDWPLRITSPALETFNGFKIPSPTISIADQG